MVEEVFSNINFFLINKDFLRISVIWIFEILWYHQTWTYSHVASRLVYLIIKLKRVSFFNYKSQEHDLKTKMIRPRNLWSHKFLLFILNLQCVSIFVIHIKLFWDCYVSIDSEWPVIFPFSSLIPDSTGIFPTINPISHDPYLDSTLM